MNSGEVGPEPEIATVIVPYTFVVNVENPNDKDEVTEPVLGKRASPSQTSGSGDQRARGRHGCAEAFGCGVEPASAASAEG